jgi:ribosome-associated protein
MRKMMNFKEILKECTYKSSRSGGAGGQHVNKVETKVELIWKPAESQVLTIFELKQVLNKLAKKLDTEGLLHFTSQESRSQLRNKALAQEKLKEALVNALKKEKRRKPTKIAKGAKEKRLKVKRVKSENKQNRKKVKW